MEVKAKHSVMFISFDAVAVSGITVEVCKLARKFSEAGYQCYLDLGYDIKIDKGNFFKPYDNEQDTFHDVISLCRLNDLKSISGYSREFIKYAHDVLISEKIKLDEGEKIKLRGKVEEVAQQISQKLVAQWIELGVEKIIVENGTLPENIIYTRALYLSIARYGDDFSRGKFVVWRDHDLMWNSEKNVMKYGVYPWSDAIKPCVSPYINYVTLNHDLKTSLRIGVEKR